MNAHLVDCDVAVSGYAEFEQSFPVLVYMIEIEPDEVPAAGDDEKRDEFDQAVLAAIAESDDAPGFNRYDVEVSPIQALTVMCEVWAS